ncbi:hypothetical protein AJ79_05444 [Helicocarpus griseus UAMH5409]|uniref:FAD dependent oxidoreductase domain-containing protein n=1 Tax=Helicocarpus griseus UAMH5409 TaxID=1447875 RepID=A0A2B7XMY9_9EURO|nr:hypothetical protein AJ79_05444 [Helicocarpus griseus UAMH5409]
MSTTSFSTIREHPSENSIFIVGGGIVGAALAYYLSKDIRKDDRNLQVVVLDKSLGFLLGSTTYAPGFVGQYNQSPVETRLAMDSVREYSTIPDGFSAVGGMELASTEPGVERLKKRCSSAKAAGLPAEIITAEKASALAPDFVKTETIRAGLHFPSDGTANGGTIASYFRQKAAEYGACFVEVAVKGFETKDNGEIRAISTSEGPLNIHSTDSVILATGLWTQFLLKDALSQKPITKSPIPIVPIGHPYTFTSSRPARKGPPYPFVRWPEYHVYARDHGTHDGMGAYNHRPIPITDPVGSAVGTWSASFETALAEAARTCLKNGERFLTVDGCTDEDVTTSSKRKPFNGIFSVTPDNLPMAGRVKDCGNLWLCAAVWITHAAGTAKLIAQDILRTTDSEVSADDAALLMALDPNRFLGRGMEELTRMALGRYNDIYNSQPL